MQIEARGGGAGLGLVGQGSLSEEFRFQEFPGGGGQTHSPKISASAGHKELKFANLTCILALNFKLHLA